MKDSKECYHFIQSLKMKPMDFKANKFRLTLTNQLNCSNRSMIEDLFTLFLQNLV